MGTEKMSPEEIFNIVIEIVDPVERAAYLDKVCGQDTGLRAEVESLLKAHEETGSFLKAPVLDPEITLDHTPPSEHEGTVIGPYKLLERIGKGGMAYVYMAEQVEPLRRRVALKIIKLGWSIIARA